MRQLLALMATIIITIALPFTAFGQGKQNMSQLKTADKSERHLIVVEANSVTKDNNGYKDYFGHAESKKGASAIGGELDQKRFNIEMLWPAKINDRIQLERGAYLAIAIEESEQHWIITTKMEVLLKDGNGDIKLIVIDKNNEK